MTNYEKMCVSLDEAARIIRIQVYRGCPPRIGFGCCESEDCYDCWREWLESEAESEE